MYLIKYNYILYILVCISIVFDTLAAYNIFIVPIPWLVSPIVILMILVKIHKKNISNNIYVKILFIYIIYAAVVTYVNSLLVTDKSIILSTPYIVFINLRLFNIITFIAFTIILIYLYKNNYKNKIYSFIINIGFIVSVYSIYVYFAQLYGLPEIPRTRGGTGIRDEQAVEFAYAFHRAMGTFREPSHLAQFLIIPIFLSMIKLKNNKVNIIKLLFMMLCLLMTGSLTGIISLIIGFILALLIEIRKVYKYISLKGVILVIVIMTLLIVILENYLININNNENYTSVLYERVIPVLTSDDGVRATNRGDVYRYLDAQEQIYIAGQGLGNSNIELANFRNQEVVSTFWSLYLNVYFSLGIIGLTILLTLLLIPICIYIIKDKDREKFFILGAYISFLVVYAVHAQEFNMIFSIIYAYIIFRLTAIDQNYSKKIL